jgi:hypothetical protein
MAQARRVRQSLPIFPTEGDRRPELTAPSRDYKLAVPHPAGGAPGHRKRMI